MEDKHIGQIVLTQEEAFGVYGVFHCRNFRVIVTSDQTSYFYVSGPGVVRNRFGSSGAADSDRLECWVGVQGQDCHYEPTSGNEFFDTKEELLKAYSDDPAVIAFVTGAVE